MPPLEDGEQLQSVVCGDRQRGRKDRSDQQPQGISQAGVPPLTRTTMQAERQPHRQMNHQHQRKQREKQGCDPGTAIGCPKSKIESHRQRQPPCTGQKRHLLPAPQRRPQRAFSTARAWRENPRLLPALNIPKTWRIYRSQTAGCLSGRGGLIFTPEFRTASGPPRTKGMTRKAPDARHFHPFRCHHLLDGHDARA